MHFMDRLLLSQIHPTMEAWVTLITILTIFNDIKKPNLHNLRLWKYIYTLNKKNLKKLTYNYNIFDS